MKKLFYFIAFGGLLISTVTFFACQKLDDSNHQVQLQQPYEKEIHYISETYGFDKKTIMVSDSFLIAEGDISFRITDIQDELTKAQPRKHYVDKTMYKEDFLNVRVPPSTPQVWRTAITKAISNWNALPATKNKITMSYVGNATLSSASSTINVKYEAIANVGNVVPIASATLPNEGTPRYLRINSTYTGTLTPEHRTYIMTHELGHAIGFFHTDVSGNSQALQLQANMPQSCKGADPSSIMQEGTATGLVNWSDFSSCDKTAYNVLCGMRK